MALQYQSLSHGDLGGSGIDALSSEDAIQDGYAEDLLNVDASPQGYLSKRVGYQQIYGQLPVRVLGMEYLTDKTIQFTLDSSIDLSNIASPLHSRPVVVVGKNSAASRPAGSSATVTVQPGPTYYLQIPTPPNNGDVVSFTTTGTLPTGLSLNTEYYVRLVGTGPDFQVASGSVSGSTVILSSAGTGVLTLNYRQGDFRTDILSSQYYPRFDADVRRSLPHSTSTPSEIEIPVTEHGLSTPFVSIGTALSTSTVNRSSQVFLADSVSINETTLEIDVSSYNGGPNARQYVYWSDKTPRPGFVYVSSTSTPFSIASSSIEQFIQFSPATHGLTSKNIQVDVYQIVGSVYKRVTPSSVTIGQSGSVLVGFLNSTGSAFDVFCILTAVDPDHVLSSNSWDPGTGLVTLRIQDPPTPYLLASCYRQEGTDFVQVYPDAIEYSDGNNEFTIQFYSAAGNTNFAVYWEPGYIISNRLRVPTNTFTKETFQDTRPQLTLWGFDHANLYLNPKDTRAGWVTHLDTYRSAGNNFLVAGLGGNLFSGKELDAGTKVAYKIPTLYPNLRSRVQQDTVCGPAFSGQLSGPSTRTGGQIGGTGWGNGLPSASSLTYITTLNLVDVSLLGYVRIVLRSSQIVNLSPTTGLFQPIVVNKDWMNIEDAGNPIHDGIWKVVAWDSYSSAYYPEDPRVEIVVQNLNIKALLDINHTLAGTSIWNSTTGAKCGIFSGRLTLTTAADKVNFLPGDTLISSNLTASEPIQVAEVSGNTLNLLNFYQLESFPAATTIVGRRNSDVISIRNPSDEESVDGLVGTDNLRISGYTRQFKIKSVNPLPTLDILSITNDAGTATANISVAYGDGRGATVTPGTGVFTITPTALFQNGDPVTLKAATLPAEANQNTIYYVINRTTYTFQLANAVGGAPILFSTAGSGVLVYVGIVQPAYAFAAGDKLALSSAEGYTGNVQVTGIVDETQIQFQTDSSLSNLTFNATTMPMHLIGKTAYIDEAVLWEDSLSSSITVDVPGRWIPIEAPEHASDSAPTTYKRYLENSAYDEQPILRSTQVSDTLFLNNGDDRSFKVDGSNLYRPGLIRWQPQLFFSQATAVGYQNIPLVSIQTPLVSPYWDANRNHFYVNEADVGAFTNGTQIRRDKDLSTIYTVIDSTSSANGSSHLVYVDKTIVGTPAADTLKTTSTYSYYFRLNAVDANQNVVASAATGSYNCTVKVSSDFQNRIRLVGLPTLDILDYDRIEVQIYRTKQNGVAPYYLLSTIALPFDRSQGYIDWIDTYADSDIGLVSQLDPVNTALKGQELGTGWTSPVRAKHLTSAANRLILGNLTSDPYIDLTIRNLGSSVYSTDLVSKRFLLRKSNLDNSTNTNMLDRIGYQFVDSSGAHSISSVSYSNPLVTVTFSAAHGRSVGDWIYLYSSRSLPNLNTYLMGWWQVSAINSPTSLSFKWIASSDTPVPLFSSFAATTTNNSPTVTTASTANLKPGAAVSGTNIPAGTYIQSITNGTTFVLTANATGGGATTLSISTEVDKMVHATDGQDVPVFLGTDWNWQTANGQPVLDPTNATRFKGIQNLAMYRLASAVNSTQRMCDTLISGYELFTPWIVANAGGEYSEGQLLLTQPMNQAQTFELVLPSSLSDISVFANGIQRVAGDQIQAQEDLHPSRILVSYPNFPEIFDSPFSSVDSQSDSAIDINPADGQEITAVVPFFGSSAFGAALKDAVIVVFKTNSIYVVNLAAKAAGQNAVQKIESQGLGCMASYSVAAVRDGIMFANASGIYKLRTDLTVYYMGRYMQRQWRNRVSTDKLHLVFGHNWSFGSQYKLSLPTDDSSVPDETFVYNSTREYSLEGPNTQAHREGSWVRHRGFSSIGWCNLDADSFYANTKGQVLLLRRTGEASDWRDDETQIEMDVVLRAMDFGDEGIRKTVPYALISYRNPLNLGVRTGTQVFYTTDLFDSFYEADATVIPNRAESSGTGDTWSQKVVTFRYSFNNKRGIRFQLRITNNLKDESVEIARVRYSVAGLSIKGIMQAAQSPAYYKT